MKLRIYIKHMKAECRIPKSNRYDLHVKGQGHFIKKLQVLSGPYLIYHFIYNHHTLHASMTGMVVCRIPLLGHCDLLFTVYCTSKENLVQPITFILFNVGSSNLACKYKLR